MRYALLVLLAAALTGCATAPSGSLETVEATIDASAYGEVFERAKAVLRDANFTIDRVDARRGVLTTEPSASVGFVTPWMEQHESVEEAWLGLVHREQRVAVVSFEPVSGTIDDLRLWDGSLRVRVDVIVERVEQRGRRHDASGILYSSLSTRIENDRSDSLIPVAVERRIDAAFSKRIARQILTPAERQKIESSD